MFRLMRRLQGVVAVVLVSTLPLGGDRNAVVESQSLLAVVEFVAPLAPVGAVSLLARHSTIVELRHQYGVDAERGGGYFVRPGTPSDRIVGGFLAAFDRSIRDMAAEAERLVAITNGAPEALARRDRTRAVGLGIAGATVAISDAAIASLRNEASVKSVRQRAVKRTTAKGMSGALAAPRATHVARSYWVPDLVYTTLTQGSPSHRYAQNYIWWNSGRSLWFGQMGGIELDVFTNYYDGLAYFTTSDFFGFPSTQMWDSDLPGKYLGNRAFDPSGEKAYTIGSTQGHMITTGRWYYTYIQLNFGNAGSDTAKSMPQLKYCVDENGYCDAYSQVSDDTCPFGFWPISVPVVSRTWTRTGGAPGQDPCV